jgi:hypothetical protein
MTKQYFQAVRKDFWGHKWDVAGMEFGLESHAKMHAIAMNRDLAEIEKKLQPKPLPTLHHFTWDK